MGQRVSGIAAWLRRRIKHRGVLQLVAGTAVAQLVLVAVSPILTRLYTPSDFGLFALYVSIVFFGNSVASLRYEFAIPLPQEDEEGRQLLYLTMLITGAFATVTLLLILLGRTTFAGWLGEPRFATYLWIVPLGLFFESVRVATRQCAIRFKNYRTLAWNDAGQAFLRAAGQVSLGFAPITSGLIVGDLVGRIGGASALLFNAVPGFGQTVRATRFGHLRTLAGRYRRFAILSTPATLLNSMTQYVPIVLLTRYYGLTVAGFYAFSQRLVGLPLLILGKSILQVYFGRAAELRRSGTRSIKRLFIRTLRGTLLIGLFVIAPIGLVGSFITPSIFGEAWTEAGIYLRILLPMYIIQFAATSVGLTLAVMERQDLHLRREIFRLVTKMGLLGGVIFAKGSSQTAIWALSMAGSLGYGVHLWTSWVAVRTPQSGVVDGALSSSTEFEK